MIASDEDALICDFAQTYHVLDWRALPLRLAATLAAGLPESSRSVMKLSGQKAPVEMQLQAVTADTLNVLEWRMRSCKGAVPKSILGAILGEESGQASDLQSFDSPEEFEAAMRAVEGG